MAAIYDSHKATLNGNPGVPNLRVRIEAVLVDSGLRNVGESLII